MQKMTLLCICLAGLLLGTAAHAETGNMLKNPNFENSDVNWSFHSEGQDSVIGEISAQSYRPKTGLSGAKIVTSETPNKAVSWVQHVRVDDPSQMPNEASVWFNGSAGATLRVTPVQYTTDSGRKAEHDFQSVQVALPSVGDWKQARVSFDFPDSVRAVRFELLVTGKGEYAFDDAELTRQARVDIDARPEGITVIGLRRFWGAGSGGDPMPAPMREALEEAGLGPIRSVEWDHVTPQSLRQSEVVLLLLHPKRLTLTQKDHAIIQLLKDYVSGGGGLLFGCNRQQLWSDFFIARAIARDFGLKLLVEKVEGAPDKTWQIGEWYADRYTYTDQVFPPINDGVQGVLFHTTSDWSFRGVVPFEVQDEAWKIVMHSGPNASSTPLPPIGLETLDRDFRESGFEQDVPLMAVRDYGKGHVAYLGVNMPNIFTRVVDNQTALNTYTQYVRDGHAGHASDMLRVIVNTFTWLGQGASALQGKALALADATQEARFDQGWKLRRGVIGPRTTYSSGKATPEQYVAKAKELGLDFIVFLEDFAEMEREDFDKLRADCERLTTSDFVAVPGITYTNGDGNHQYAYSNQLLMPSEALLDESGDHILCGDEADGIGELRWLYELNSFENQAGWYNFKDNPYPHYDTRNVASMGVITQKDGKIVERVVKEWAYSNFHDQLLWPHALTLATSPDELDGVATGDVYVNVVGTHGYEHLFNVLTTYPGARARSHNFPGSAPFGGTSVSNGPMINLQAPRADTDTKDGGIYSRKLQVWPLNLTVTSEHGLKEVRLMDGERVIRRYLPGGENSFEIETGVSLEHQRQIWVHAFDSRGGEAFTRALNSNAWLMRETQCGDRNNQLFGSRQYRDDGTLYFHGYTGTNATPSKGPWNGKVRPVGAFIFDKELGLGSTAFDGGPEGEPSLWLGPEVWWGGKKPKWGQNGKHAPGWFSQLVTDREGGPHIRPERIVASADVLSADMVLDGVFPVNDKPVIHVWYTMQPVLPAETIKTNVVKTLYLCKVEGVNMYLVEQTVEALKDIPIGEDRDWGIKLGKVGGGARLEGAARKLGDKPMNTNPASGKFTFRKGDYVGFYGDPFGSLAVYNIGDPLILEGDPKNYSIHLPSEGDVIPKGTVYKMRLLLAGMNNQTPDPVALTEQLQQQYGLGVEGTGYTVQLDAGTVVGNEYELQMRANSMGQVAFSIDGLDELAGNLGAKIHGLNANWTACLQRGGDAPDVRVVPVTGQGVGYAVLQAELEERPVFIGHPYTASNSDAVLGLSRTTDHRSWVLEVHNPTDQPMSVAVRTADAWLGPVVEQTFELEPGSSQIHEIGPAIP